MPAIKLAANFILLAVPFSTCGQTFDFESGISGWTIEGAAFQGQPFCASAMPSARFAITKIGGDYWKGLDYPLGQHGRCIATSGDKGDLATGAIRSTEFPLDLARPYFRFRIGGSDDLANERLELQVKWPANDLPSFQNRLRDWRDFTHSDLIPDTVISDGDFVVAVRATGHNSEALRQAMVTLPNSLLNLAARIRILDSSAAGHINADYITLTANAPEPFVNPVWGYADYHTHPQSYWAFGGINNVHAIWGYPGDDFQKYQNDPSAISADMPHCIRGHGGGPLADEFVSESQILPNDLDFSIARFLFGHRRSGGPQFRNFPARVMGAHQQMHITQIHRNWEGGLRLMVALTTENIGPQYFMGRVVNGHIDLLREQDSLKKQVEEFKRQADNNRSWMEIAYSPADARRIILHNKLAVVIGIEMDQLGTYGYPSPEEEVADLWKMGIRAVTPIHAVNNLLGGPAITNDAYNTLNDLTYRGIRDITTKQLPAVPPAFFEIDYDKGDGPIGERVTYSFAANQIRVVIQPTLFSLFRPAPWPHLVPETGQRQYGYKNKLGLTASCGRRYIAALRDHGMIIDLAHMSDKSIDDTFEVLGGNYPAIFSHAHFRRQAVQSGLELVPDFKPREYDVSDSRLDRMFHNGGVVGPFLGEDRVDGNGGISGMANDCWMSSKMFAFSFHYARSRLAASGGTGGVGMASDFDFIPETAPRFGSHACIGLEPFLGEVVEAAIHSAWYQPLAQHDGVRYQIKHPARYAKSDQDPLVPYQMGSRIFDFNEQGLAHFGLVPDMLQDLKNVGMPADDLQALFGSAESYIRMWEKSVTAQS